MASTRRSRIFTYGVALASVAVAFAISFFIPDIEPTPAILFLAAVMVSSWYGGIGPGVAATVLSVLLLDYYFLPPIHSVDLGRAEHVSLGVFLLVAVLINSNHVVQQRLERVLRQQNRRKSDFMAVLAHELRNFLAPISSSIAVVKLRGRGDKTMEESCHAAERQVRNMSRLIDDLLDVARINEGKLRLDIGPEDLREIVLHAVEGVRSLMDARGHCLDVSLPSGPLPVEVDRTRVEQVLMNLLTNAAKYTDPGGRIALTMERSGAEVTLRVRDNGRGLERDMLPYIFDLFMQAETGSQGGLGIGLSLTRGLVQMHGGSITASSDGLGHGSEFVVRLPAAGLKRGEIAADSPPADAMVAGHDKIA